MKKIFYTLLFYIGLPHELIHLQTARWLGAKSAAFRYFYVEVEEDLPPAKIILIALAPSIVTLILLCAWTFFFPRGFSPRLDTLFKLGVLCFVIWLFAPIHDYQLAFNSLLSYFKQSRGNHER